MNKEKFIETLREIIDISVILAEYGRCNEKNTVDHSGSKLNDLEKALEEEET